MSEDVDPFERWPGFNEQSWSERFAILDRMYQKLAKDQWALLGVIADKNAQIARMKSGSALKEETP